MKAANQDTIKIVQYGSDWEFKFPENMYKNSEEFYDAIEQMNDYPKKAEKEFKKRIEQNPKSHIDAYNLLGILYKDQGNPIEGNALVEKAYAIGKKAIDEFIKTKKFTLDWGYLDNRPFLRACCQMGLNCMEANQFKEASSFFEFIIKCNPNDNQGVRFTLINCYLEDGRFEEVIKLSKKYKGEEKYSFEWYYGKGLAYYFLNELELAKEEFSKGKEAFPIVYQETQRKANIQKPIDKISGASKHVKGLVLVGSELEAYEYYNRLKKFFGNREIKNFIRNA